MGRLSSISLDVWIHFSSCLVQASSHVFSPLVLGVPGHVWKYRVFEKHGLKGRSTEIVFKQMSRKSQKCLKKMKWWRCKPLPWSSPLVSVYFWILGTENVWELKNRKQTYSLLGCITIWNSEEYHSRWRLDALRFLLAPRSSPSIALPIPTSSNPPLPSQLGLEVEKRWRERGREGKNRWSKCVWGMRVGMGILRRVSRPALSNGTFCNGGNVLHPHFPKGKQLALVAMEPLKTTIYLYPQCTALCLGKSVTEEVHFQFYWI